MSTIEKLISALVGLVILALAIWWFSDSVIASIRAPVVAELSKAQNANESLVTAKEKAEAETARLNILLAARTDREAKADRKLEGLKNALDKLASTKADVRAWADTVIPSSVIELRQLVPENGSPGRPFEVRDTNKPDGANKPAATTRAWIDKQPIVEKSRDAGNTGEPLQPAPAGRAIVPAKQTLIDRIKRAWGE